MWVMQMDLFHIGKDELNFSNNTWLRTNWTLLITRGREHYQWTMYRGQFTLVQMDTGSILYLDLKYGITRLLTHAS